MYNTIVRVACQYRKSQKVGQSHLVPPPRSEHACVHTARRQAARGRALLLISDLVLWVLLYPPGDASLVLPRSTARAIDGAS